MFRKVKNLLNGLHIQYKCSIEELPKGLLLSMYEELLQDLMPSIDDVVLQDLMPSMGLLCHRF